MWVYNDKLQIKFTFRSGPMIFGQVMALGLRNFAKYLVVTLFFTMVGDIDLIFKVKGQGHRVKFLPHSILVNTLESTSLNGF